MGNKIPRLSTDGRGLHLLTRLLLTSLQVESSGHRGTEAMMVGTGKPADSSPSVLNY